MNSVSNNEITVLLVSDDSQFVEAVTESLEREAGHVSVHQTGDIGAGLELLSEQSVDCILTDHTSSAGDGISFLKRVREDYPELPFVLVTETPFESIAEEAVGAGLTDHFRKNTGEASITFLARSVLRTVEHARTTRSLERERDLFTEAQEIATLGAWETDLKRNEGWWTEQVNRIYGLPTGYEPDPGEGIEHFHPEDRPVIREAFETLKETGEPFDLELRVEAEDGESKWVRTRGNAQFEDGEVLRVRGTIRDITDRKKRESQLQQYKQAVESTRDLIAAADEDLNYLFANRAYREFFDFGNTPVTSQTIKDVLDETTVEEIEPQLQTALDGSPVQMEVKRQHPQKGQRVLDCRLFPLESPDGDVYGVGVSMRDITEERERKAAIKRESESRRVMSEVNHALVRGSDIEAVMSRIAGIVGSSSLFECTFTYLMDVHNTDLVCSYDSDLTATDAKAFHTEAYLDRVFEAGVYEIDDVTAEPFVQHEPGRQSHAGVAVGISYNDERYGVLTVHLPPGEAPSKQKKDLLDTISEDIGYFTFNQLLRSEHKSFTEIVQRIDDPVMIQNLDGNYRLINQAVADLADQSQEALIGRDEFTFLDREAAKTIEEMKERVIETEKPVSYQVSPTFPDGSERTFSTTRYPYYDEQGTLDGTIAICRDVTDLEEHKRQLEVLDRVLRHNMNNNMTVVKGYASMLETDAGPEAAQYAAKIRSNTEEILEISRKQRKITDFLSDTHTIDYVDIGSVIERLALRFEHANPRSEITMEGVTETQVLAINAIEEAVRELLNNSLVHSDQLEPKVTVRMERNEETVRVQVIDENPQIADMDLEILRGNERLGHLHHGSGLGLWLVKLAVTHSNGEVHHEPNEPKGNIVTIELNRG